MLLFLPEYQLSALINQLYDWGELFWVKTRENNRPRLTRATKEQIHDYRLPACRGIEPLKRLLLPSKQRVAEYPEESQQVLEVEPKKRVILGLTQCDLAGIRIFDRVFLEDEEYIDPFYVTNRKNLLLVTIDCSDAYPSCFCTLVKGQPYPKEGFDLNLTPLDNGYLIEVGTSIGEELIRGIEAPEATESAIAQREKIRRNITKKIENQNKLFKTEQGFIKLVTENQEEHKSYEHHGSTCVSCGACTYICPGCFCFGIYDNSKNDSEFERLTTWDSCQLSGFSRMAGMLNPRGRIAQRFMHRYNHKFFHYPWRYDGWTSCVGCGRCIDNCMGRIDMRAVLRDLSVSDVSQMYPVPSPTVNHTL